MSKYIYLLSSLFIFSSLKAQEGVFIEVGEKGGNVKFGQGILKSRGGECFVISPAHLFNEGTESFNIVGRNNRLSKANNLTSFETYDLAISRVTSGSDQSCEAWAVPLDFKQVLLKANQATVETKLDNGETVITYVKIVKKESENIEISPLPSEGNLKQGYSGSPVYINESGRKILIGILLEVEDGGRQASLMPANDMERILGGFFDDDVTNSIGLTTNSKTEIKEKAPILEPFEDIGIRFSLIDYKKSGSKLTFNFIVTALEKDEYIDIRTSSVYGYDENGSEVRPKKITIGNSKGSSAKQSIIQGISTPMTITFDDFPSSSTGVSLLKVTYRVKGGISTFEMRNLPTNQGNEFVKSKYKGVWSFDDIGISYELLDYKKSGSKLTFNFIVTALEKDEYIDIRTSSVYGYDENGSEVRPKKITIGNSRGSSAKHSIIKGIPTPMSITFDDFPSSSTGVSLLKVTYRIKGGISTFEIRDIAFER